MSWLTVSKATMDPRTKQTFCLQYKLLHITFCKAAIALRFAGSRFALQAFQRGRMEQPQFLPLESKWRPGECTVVFGKWKLLLKWGVWQMKTFNEQDDSYRWLLGGAVQYKAVHQTPPDIPWEPGWLYVALECCWVFTVKSQTCLLQWSCSWLASIANKIIQLFFWKINRSTMTVKHDDSSKVGCLIFLPYFLCLFCHMKCL